MAQRPKRRETLSCREVNEEMVILDRSAGHVHQLNTTATFIWQRCDGEHSTEDISRELAKVFEVDATTLDRDVEEALRQLAALGLLENDGASGGS